MLSEVVTCNRVRNPGGHAVSNPRPSEEGVSFYHILRLLDREHALNIASMAFRPCCLPAWSGMLDLGYQVTYCCDVCEKRVMPTICMVPSAVGWWLMQPYVATCITTSFPLPGLYYFLTDKQYQAVPMISSLELYRGFIPWPCMSIHSRAGRKGRIMQCEFSARNNAML